MNKPSTQNKVVAKVKKPSPLKGKPNVNKGKRLKRISPSNPIQGEVMDILEEVALKYGLSLDEVKKIYYTPFFALDDAIKNFNCDDSSNWVCIPFKYLGMFEPNLVSINAIRRNKGLPNYKR